MNLILAMLAVSALAVALTSHTRTRRIVRDINAITSPHVPARHAVVRNPSGRRQRPNGTMPMRERIPIQVPPEIEAANARIIEGYDEHGENDDLLIRPFTFSEEKPVTSTWRTIPDPDRADDTTAVVAVP